MKSGFLVLVVAIVIVSSGLVSAEFVLGNGSFIELNYYGGEFIRGKLNMSFEGELSGSKFLSNFGGSVSLIELLNKSGAVAGINYKCTPSDCEEDYSKGASEAYEDVDFNIVGGKVLGFELSGNEVEVNALDFEIYSGVSSSCKSQIQIDFLDDGEVDFFNTKYKNIACGEKNFGCFEGESEQYTFLAADETSFLCERVTLPPAPAYKIGALVQGTGGTLAAGLYTLTGQAACGGGKHGGGGTPIGGEFGVIAGCPFNEEFEGLVCIVNQGESEDYRIRIEQNDESCGVRREGSQLTNVSADYEIFAQPLAYDTLGWLDLNAAYYNLTQKNLYEIADDYIEENYGRDCTEGCYIPISFAAGEVTNLDLEQNLRMRTTASKSLKYETDVAPSVTEREFYFLSESDFLIDSNFTILDLEKAEFKVPEVNEEREFTLSFNGEILIEEEIGIETGFEFQIAPRFILIGQNVIFSVNSEEDINSTRWSFGDGSPSVIGAGASAAHTYAEEGEYIIDIEAVNSDGESSKKKVRVIVGEPKVSSQILVQDYEIRLNSLKGDIEKFPEWQRPVLEEAIGFETIETGFVSTKNKFENLHQNASDEEYVEIIEQLLALEIPDDVGINERGSFPGELGFSNIDVSNIAVISGEEVRDARIIREGIENWIYQNYDLTLEFESVASRKNLEERIVMRNYKINLNKIGSPNQISYLIINYPAERMKFNGAIDVRSMQGKSAVYIPIDSSSAGRSVEFSIGGNAAPKIESLGIFVSPVIGELGISDKPYEGISIGKIEFRWARFIIAFSLFLLAFLTVYISLQSWYKKSYEKHLFKDSNDLYNLVNFIYNSRRGGMHDGEIRDRLKEKKWSGEQLSYAFRKIDGKRTGMWEIPLFKFVENRKVKKELEKRQGGRPIDARFIKRPSF